MESSTNGESGVGNRESGLEPNSERHVKTPAEMARLFADLPEAIANTLEISARLQFSLADLGYERLGIDGSRVTSHCLPLSSTFCKRTCVNPLRTAEICHAKGTSEPSTDFTTNELSPRSAT